MAKGLMALRASADEKAAWAAAADKAGRPVTTWMRNTLNEAIAFEKATEKAPKRVEDQRQSSPLKDEIYPQEAVRCVHRLMPGTWCKKCGVAK